MTPEQEIEQVTPIIESKAGLSNLTLGTGAAALAAQEARQTILNYCNIQCMPLPALLYVWASMSIDILIYYAQVTASSAGTSSSSSSSNNTILSGVSLGGLSVSFSQKSNSLNGSSGSAMGGSATLDADKLVQNYKQQLRAFRKMKW